MLNSKIKKKKTLLRLFFQTQHNPMFNLSFLKNFIVAYLLLLRDNAAQEEETSCLLQTLTLSFQGHLEQLLHLILLLRLDDFKPDYLKTIFLRILVLQAGRRPENLLFFTRQILCLKKLRFLDSKIPLAPNLPVLVPFSDEFGNFRRIFGHVEETR